MQHIWNYFNLNHLGTFDKYSDGDIITSKFDDIFIRQENNYDCGIACIRMALNFKKLNNEAIDSSIIHRNSPMWTIDLYYQLRILNVNCCFYTRHAFVRDELYNYEWYQKHGKDRESANANFELCKVCAMCVLQCV